MPREWVWLSDGLYAVYDGEFECAYWFSVYGGLRIACYGGFCNAIHVQGLEPNYWE